MSKDFLIKASVQYNDAVGTTALDYKDQLVWTEYLKEIGVDLNVYLPFSFKYTLEEIPMVNRERKGHLIIYTVKKDEVGDNYDKLNNYLEKNNKKLPVYLFSKELSIDEFYSNFKRFEITFDYIRPYEGYFNDTIIDDVKEETSL